PPASLESLALLPDALQVTILDGQTFIPTGVTAEARAAGLGLMETYQTAVDHLRDFLAQTDPKLYRACSLAWEELGSAQVVLAANLGLEIPIPDRLPVRVPARAYVWKNPLLVCFQDRDAAGAFEAGGRAVASLFVDAKGE